jgi:hypothetical protein
MNHDYGFLRRGTGADGEGLDVFLGPDQKARNVHVIHQNNPDTGKYDEDKVMLGWNDPDEARAAYLSNYDTPKFYRSMTVMPMATFRKMLTNGEPGGAHWKRKHQREHETTAMFSADNSDLLNLLELSRALTFAAESEEEGHWVTLESGTHVFINGEGVVTKGPTDLTKHPLYDKKTGTLHKSGKSESSKSLGRRVKQIQEQARAGGGNVPFKKAWEQAEKEQKEQSNAVNEPGTGNAGENPVGGAGPATTPSVPESAKGGGTVQPQPVGENPAVPKAGVSLAKQLGMFGPQAGQEIGALTGSQKGLFGEPQKEQPQAKGNSADERIARQYDPSATNEMFPAKEAANETQPHNPERPSASLMPSKSGKWETVTKPDGTREHKFAPAQPKEETPPQEVQPQSTVPGEGAAKGQAQGKVEPPSEQSIAQSVNRGEIPVEDVLNTHPHLAADALVEQHRREEQDRIEQAEAEKESDEAEHAQGAELEGSGELPDFGPELEQGNEPAVAEPTANVGGSDEGGQTISDARNPRSDKTAKQPARSAGKSKGGTKGHIEKLLLDNYERENSDQEIADDEAINRYHQPFTFHRDPKTKSGLPGEVEHFLEGAPRGVKRLFEVTDDPAKGNGADAFGDLGDEYFRIAERRGGMTGRLRQAIDAAKNSPDPEVQWMASYYDLPSAKGIKGKSQVKANQLATGSTGTIKGIPVEVAKDDDGHRVLRDGGDLPDVPLDALTMPVPFDKGSVKPGKVTSEAAPESPAEPKDTQNTPVSEAAPEATKPAPEPAPEPSAATPEAKAPEPEPQDPVTPQPSPTQPLSLGTPELNQPAEQPEQAEPESPEQIQEAVTSGLSNLGENPKRAEQLAQGAIEAGAVTVQDALAWAFRNRGTFQPKATAPAIPGNVGIHGTPPLNMPGGVQPRTTPTPMPKGWGQGIGSPMSGGKPTAQQVRAKAAIPPPPSNLPPLQPPLAGTRAIGGKKPAAAVPKIPHIPAGREREPESSLAQISRHIHPMHGAGHVHGRGQHSQATHKGRKLGSHEANRGRGRTLQQLNQFSAECDEAMARTLELLSMVES